VGIRSEEIATFEEEGAKEAPEKYILDILWKIYPHAESIENVRGKHMTGVDWILHWKNGNMTNIDDKNDLWLGYTGNISLDEKTTQKTDVYQLFVNYPTFEGKYIMIFNHLIPHHILTENRKHGRKQEWGKYTYTYIVPLKKLKHRIYDIHPNLANPSFNWFCKKRKKPTHNKLYNSP